MDPKNPTTWRHFADHPSAEEFGLVDRFESSYREQYGDPSADPDVDLAAMRAVAERLLLKFPSSSIELVLLDDLTTFVEFSCGTLVGSFGLGCDDGTFYLHLDANPSDLQAPEAEWDNLSAGEVVQLVDGFGSCDSHEG